MQLETKCLNGSMMPFTSMLDCAILLSEAQRFGSCFGSASLRILSNACNRGRNLLPLRVEGSIGLA